MSVLKGRDIFTETMAHKIAVFLLGHDEFTTGNVVFQLEDECLYIDQIEIDDEGDIIFNLKY